MAFAHADLKEIKFKQGKTTTEASSRFLFFAYVERKCVSGAERDRWLAGFNCLASRVAPSTLLGFVRALQTADAESKESLSALGKSGLLNDLGDSPGWTEEIAYQKCLTSLRSSYETIRTASFEAVPLSKSAQTKRERS